MNLLKQIAGAGVIGSGMAGLVTFSHSSEKLSTASGIAVGLSYPLFIMPVSLIIKATVNRLTNYFTPYQYIKTIKETPWRINNYAFNKRYMLIDLFLNQGFLQFVLAGGLISFLKQADKRIGNSVPPAPTDHRFQRSLSQQDWVYLAKLRWAIILFRVMGDFSMAYLEVGGRNTRTYQGIYIAILNIFWQMAVIQLSLKRSSHEPANKADTATLH